MKIAKYILIGLTIAMFYTCKKKQELPSVSTIPVSNIGDISALSGGYISGSDVVEKGVCISKSSVIDITNNTCFSGGPRGENFQVSLMNLTPGTTYFIRAYAINSAGTALGNEITFTTKPNSNTTFRFTSAQIRFISQSSAICEGDVENPAGIKVNSYGVCYSTNPNPSIESNKFDTTRNDVYYYYPCKLKGLYPGTRYYAKAYVKTSQGIIYSPEVTFNTFKGTVMDYEGNTYNTILIGGKEWMAENLKTTRYRNGDAITHVDAWGAWTQYTVGAYCYYDNNAGYTTIKYGALYNQYAVMDARNIAPEGWHVATKQDWENLLAYIGLENARTKICSNEASAGWPATSKSSNETGLSIVPAGFRTNGYFTSRQSSSCFWTSSIQNANNFYGYSIDAASVQSSAYDNKSGFSIRCVKD